MIPTKTPLAASRSRNAAAAVIVLGLTVAGCTGGDGSGDDPSGSVPGGEPGATTTPTPEPLPTQITPSETLPSATLTGGGSGSGTSIPDVTYEVRIVGGRVSPAPGSVALAPGETLRVVLWSDRETEIHAEGFGAEVEKPVPAKSSVPLDLVGGDPGIYVVEAQDPDLVLLEVAVG